MRLSAQPVISIVARSALRIGALLGATLAMAPAAPTAPPGRAADVKLMFTDVTEAAGLAVEHRFDGSVSDIGMAAWASGGIAAGDVDGDGFVDLILVRADAGQPVLLMNLRDGTFAQPQPIAGLDRWAAGATLADYTGDGWLDLISGNVGSGRPQFLTGGAGARFVDTGAGATVRTAKNTFSTSLADIDGDGDLDLAMTHWDLNCRDGCAGDHIWQNDGDGVFRIADPQWRLPGYEEDYSFTPNFADINSDGWPDLLVAADLRTSRVFLNDLGRGWVEATDRDVITDKNGMGAAVGDYDNDGDLDWFVTSIWYEANSNSGNRLYSNHGDGVFSDVTTKARVRDGGWGWGACFADFDNDGWLDIFHTNGWFTYGTDRSKLFMNLGGRFRERAARHGIVDERSGRAVACFDYDRDGDTDILVGNHNDLPRLYRNDGGNARSFLDVVLVDDGPNTSGVGARVFVTTNGGTQMRELRCGSNYVSQNPTEAHFGLGNAVSARVRVVWPDGEVQQLGRVRARQRLVVERS